ncbi:MAG: dicarboxylate/amino acid:cation symporter [Pseudomonadota bacterium]
MQLYTKILIGMIVGVVLGFLLGPNSFLLPKSGVELSREAVVVTEAGGDAVEPLARGVETARIVDEIDRDGVTWLQIEWRLRAAGLLKLQKDKVEGAKGRKAGDAVSGWVQETVPEVRRYAPLGATFVSLVEWIGRLFLALIKMVVVPLVFFSLLVGIASLGDFRKLGRLGGRTLAYFMGTTVIALVIGMGLANLVQPGHMLGAEDRAILTASYEGAASEKVDDAAQSKDFVDQIIGIVPENPFTTMADGNMLQVIFFALMFGIALTLMDTKRAKPVVDLADRANEAMVVMVHVIMKLAPYGVAALLFKVVGTTGLSVLAALGAYSLVVLAGLALHIGLLYGAVVVFGVRLPLMSFLRGIRAAQLLAFSTSSSSAALPVTKECCEQNLRVSPEVSSFVLPIGATVNMDGTALYQGVAALFIAQIYNMDLGFMDQLTIVLTATLASVGAAGVPGAGMVTLAMVLTQVGVPTEGLALVLGVDRLLDMFRSATNVTGDATAACLMARLEGEALHVLTPEEDAADPRHGFEHRLDGGAHPIPKDED